uniref:Uncharacterized protein n=1 Tax=Meloidogyne incognita TaxID=6306 RepID=A0A914L3V4_MELIC
MCRGTCRSSKQEVPTKEVDELYRKFIEDFNTMRRAIGKLVEVYDVFLKKAASGVGPHFALSNHLREYAANFAEKDEELATELNTSAQTIEDMGKHNKDFVVNARSQVIVQLKCWYSESRKQFKQEMSDIGKRKTQLETEMKRAGVVKLKEIEKTRESKKEKDFRKRMKLLREGILFCKNHAASELTDYLRQMLVQMNILGEESTRTIREAGKVDSSSY